MHWFSIGSAIEFMSEWNMVAFACNAVLKHGQCSGFSILTFCCCSVHAWQGRSPPGNEVCALPKNEFEVSVRECPFIFWICRELKSLSCLS